MKAFERFISFRSLARFATIVSLVAAGASANLNARDDNDDDEHHEFERKIRLTATEAAPAKATGVAELEVGHHNPARSNRIEVETHGLLPGTYTATVFDRSGSLSAILGTFVVGNGDDDDDDDSDENSGKRRGRGGDDDEGEGKFPVPDSIGVADLGLLSITDAGGVEVLKGDFSDLSDAIRGHFRVRVPIVAGAAGPDASGRAELKGNASRGHGNGNLRVDARGLPASSTLVLFVNDVEVDTIRTDRKGRLRLRRNHRTVDVFSISTISLRDELGAEVLSATF
jgi:hypothetical protein